MQRREDETGFTMIELMVVIGIVGILIAIMIPTLLQARRPAQDRQAQGAPRFQRIDGAATCRASQFDTTTGWSSAWP